MHSMAAAFPRPHARTTQERERADARLSRQTSPLSFPGNAGSPATGGATDGDVDCTAFIPLSRGSSWAARRALPKSRDGKAVGAAVNSLALKGANMQPRAGSAPAPALGDQRPCRGRRGSGICRSSGLATFGDQPQGRCGSGTPNSALWRRQVKLLQTDIHRGSHGESTAPPKVTGGVRHTRARGHRNIDRHAHL